MTNKVFTKASFAADVAAIVRLSTLASTELAYGMWNPDYCSSDADYIARQFCRDMQEHLDGIRTRLVPEPPAP